MARILLADDGIEFDGQSFERGPLGGVESSVINLTAELAMRGHEVHVRNNCGSSLDFMGVKWRPISSGDWPKNVDLYIANRGDKLIPLMPQARKTIFWIHNPASYLLKWRYLSKLWRYKPEIVFIGQVHSTTYPVWAPGGQRIVIPYGLSENFCTAETAAGPPAPRAVFSSNPLRSLNWLLNLWATEIQPKVPGAELHLFTGSITYGAVGAGKAASMGKVLTQAKAMSDKGVVFRGAVSKEKLIEEFCLARCMLYRGDINETFCLAVGEAQAMGVPAVVQDRGAVIERVIDGETGFIRPTDIGFANAAVQLLKDDALWQRQHDAAVKLQRALQWSHAAASFEALIQ